MDIRALDGADGIREMFTLLPRLRLVLGGHKSKGSRFIQARPRFLGNAAKKYCAVKFSPRRERLS